MKIYKPGDLIDVQSGCVLFRGGMTELDKNIAEVQKTLMSNTDYDTNLEINTDRLGSKKYIVKQQNLKDLGSFAKDLGLKKNLEVAEIKGINFIKPNFNGKCMVGKSKDYVCVMHFNKDLKVKGNSILEENIDKVFHDRQFENFKKNNQV